MRFTVLVVTSLWLMLPSTALGQDRRLGPKDEAAYQNVRRFDLTWRGSEWVQNGAEGHRLAPLLALSQR